MLFEGCEESGSRDLPYYMDKLSARIGTPDLICCLDAGCGNYEQLWMTTSLRGNVAVNLTVEVMSEGAHSGTSSGIVPSSFRICRELLSRVEDERSGLVVPPQFHVEVPKSRVEQTEIAAGILGDIVVRQFPFVEGAHPVAKDAPISEHVLARTWRPALSVTGCDGLPPTRVAGNVMLPSTKLKMSMRLPPTLDATQAAQSLEAILTRDPPQGARVTLEKVAVGNGGHPSGDSRPDAPQMDMAPPSPQAKGALRFARWREPFPAAPGSLLPVVSCAACARRMGLMRGLSCALLPLQAGTRHSRPSG